jgi:gliding motility-associated lipoprotein GldH
LKRYSRFLWTLFVCSAFMQSCTTSDLYEKTVVIPGHSWKSSFKPAFSFIIRDTTSPYRLYFVIRHTDKYHYNNIYINLTGTQPGQDSAGTGRFDLRLGNDDTGWLGSGMDDIYEQRIPLTPKDPPYYFRKKGTYTYSIEQIMREDPLENVLNVGLRIEKIK